MFVNYRTQGLFLKKEDRGEADQLFTVYTKDFGKLEIVGKAIRKISSKLRSGAEIFYLAEIEFIQAKSHKTLTDATPIDKFKNIRKDLNRLKVAYQVSEALDDLIGGQEPDENIWDLLTEVFKKLNNFQFLADNLSIIYYYFLWNLFVFLGYGPELYNCSICEKRVAPQKIYFSSKRGGLICQDCSRTVKNTKEIKPEIVKIIRIILKKDLRVLSKINLNEDYLKSLELLSKNYISHILELIK